MSVSDRHLENLMLKEDGRLWHLDFGYILGKHPPKKGYMVPPIRINKHMVKGMGGMKSTKYNEFVSKTIDAFLYLRNYRVLIMNLMALMVDAGMENLPRNEAERILTQMNDRFMPLMSNEKVREVFEEMIHRSVNAAMADFMEVMHKMAVLGVAGAWK